MNRGPERNWHHSRAGQEMNPEKAMLIFGVFVVGAMAAWFAARGENPLDRIKGPMGTGDGYSEQSDTAKAIYDRAKQEGRTLKVAISDPGGYVNFREEPIIQTGDQPHSNIIKKVDSGTKLDVVLFRAPGYPGVDEVWGYTKIDGKYGFFREDVLEGSDGGSIRTADDPIYDFDTGQIALWNVGQ